MKRDVRRHMGGKVKTVAIPDGVRFYATNDGCQAKFDVHNGWVNWVALESPGGKGWTKTAHDMVREVFPKHGITHLVASAGSEEAEAILTAHGNWRVVEHPRRHLRWDI